MTDVKAERLQLKGHARTQYFAVVMFCGCLVGLCAVLLVTAPFLANARDGAAVAAAGVFGLLLSGGLGGAILAVQLRELRYVHVPSALNARQSSRALLDLAEAQQWTVVRDVPGQEFVAHTTDALLHKGELVAAQIRDHEVLVASICDPDVGYSLVGRRRCQSHRELVAKALASAARLLVTAA